MSFPHSNPDRILGEVPYDEVTPFIRWIDQPIAEWPRRRIQFDLADGTRVRISQKQYYAVKSPVCVECGVEGVKFIIVAPLRDGKNPKLALVTQDGILLTRDHIENVTQGLTKTTNDQTIAAMKEKIETAQARLKELYARVDALRVKAQQTGVVATEEDIALLLSEMRESMVEETKVAMTDGCTCHPTARCTCGKRKRQGCAPNW
tara:strand:+ start:1212 stop:1826 length:615 start_codon:yes stop_codon:yes gene_type:complete